MGVNIDSVELDLFKSDWPLLGDFFDMFCAAHIGTGTRRIVYEYRLNPAWVIKIEKNIPTRFMFHNVSEWELYSDMFDCKEVQKFMAPVRYISSCGRILIQDKTEPVTQKTKMPKLIPQLFSDTKTQNWGVLRGKVVCHDFANHSAFNPNKKFNRMVKPKWWSDNFYQCPGRK